jgi:hypothetical protein
VTFRFISLSPTLKASFARHGEEERERRREEEREKKKVKRWRRGEVVEIGE